MAVMKNNKPWATINPAATQSGADRNAVGVAIDFMDEYADVFEQLAERLESQVPNRTHKRIDNDASCPLFGKGVFVYGPI